MGCQTPCMTRLESKSSAPLACFFVSVQTINKTPEHIGVRRVANILNKHTIRYDCSEPPDHSFMRVVFVFSRIKQKKGVRQMKKLLTLTAVGAILTAPAMAVQKCVQFPTSLSSCNIRDSGGSFSIEMSISCSAAGISMKAIALCASASVDKGGTVSAGLVANTIDAESVAYGRYCWCKLVQPVESKWVLASSSQRSDFSSCSYDCAGICTNAMQGNDKYAELNIWPIMLENLLVD